MNTRVSFKEMAVLGAEILKDQKPISYEKALSQVWKLKIMSYLRSMNLNLKDIQDTLQELFYKKVEDQRRIKLYTGPGGADLYEEIVEETIGFKRLYISKVPRFLKVRKFKRSYTGRLYRLFKIK